MIGFLCKGARLFGYLLFVVAGFLVTQSALAANYYIGNDAACDADRVTGAILIAGLSGDPNPVFHISKNKPPETAQIALAWPALQTAELRGGYNTCQDAINGVAPTGRSAIHSNALATGANRRVIRVGGTNSEPIVRFYDVTISGGRLDTGVIPTAYGAGVFVERGIVQMYRTWVEGNWTNPASSASRGGGVALSGSGRFLSLDEGSVVRDNTAYDGGGIFCNAGATMLMEGSDIRDNRAVRGGGLHVTNGCNAPLASTANSSGRVRNNTATQAGVRSGGGIYVGANGFVSIFGSSSRRFLVTGNSASIGGGASVDGNNGFLSIEWADIDNNNGSGGGLRCSNTGPDLALTGQNIRIRNNNAGTFAGGGMIVTDGCSARLFNGVTISGNSAGGAGGGVLVSSPGDSPAHLTIEGGTQVATMFNNNATRGGAAAAFNFGAAESRLNLDNVVVSNNAATEWGGGLYAANSGAEIIMRRTLAGMACHSQFYCSDLSFNSIASANATQGAAAAARDGGLIEIRATYVESNTGTAIRAQNLTSGNGGNIRISSSVLVPGGNNRLVHAGQGRVGLYFNTLDHSSSNSSPVFLADGNGGDRRSFFFGNLFNGSTEPVLSSGNNWFATGPNGGCSGFSQHHAGNNFVDSHPAVRRYVGTLPLTPGTRLINDPTHRIIDFCDSILGGDPGVDILGNSRPHNTENPNAHGTFDLGAHEIRIPPLHTLDASRTGQGSLASSPAGINCPGTCSAIFAQGTNVQVTATPAAGWAFSHWDGNCSGSNPVCNVAMSANRTVVARFVQQFDLTLGLVGEGSVTIQPGNITCTSNCTHSFPDGASLTLTANPGPAATFTGWVGACSGTGTCNVSMTSNRSVGAFFEGPPTEDVIFQDRFQ